MQRMKMQKKTIIKHTIGGKKVGGGGRGRSSALRTPAE